MVGAGGLVVTIGLEPGLVTVTGIDGVGAADGALLVVTAAGLVGGAALGGALRRWPRRTPAPWPARRRRRPPRAPVAMTVARGAPELPVAVGAELCDEHAASVSAPPTARAAMVVRVMGVSLSASVGRARARTRVPRPMTPIMPAGLSQTRQCARRRVRTRVRAWDAAA